MVCLFNLPSLGKQGRRITWNSKLTLASTVARMTRRDPISKGEIDFLMCVHTHTYTNIHTRNTEIRYEIRVPKSFAPGWVVTETAHCYR